jgi:hypothetical protein
MGGFFYALGFFTFTGSIIGVAYSEIISEPGWFNRLISLLIGAVSGILLGIVALFLFIMAINIFPDITKNLRKLGRGKKIK